MKKILIISYFFPPANFVGGERTLGFAKYFKENGIYPIIITRQWNENQTNLTDKVENNQLVHEVNDNYEVYRLPHVGTYRDKLANKGKLKLLQKILTLKELFFSNFFIKSLPFANFHPFAKKLIANDDSIVALLASGRPFQSFFIGSQLKKQFPHLLWIPDYRDEWNTHQVKNNTNLIFKLLSFFERKSERKWTINADFFLSVSEKLVESISSFIKKDGVAIKNGYWEINLNQNNNDFSKKLVITYAGTVYPYQDFSVFIPAVINLLKKGENITVNFIGIETIKNEEFRLKNRVKGFENNFHFLGRLPKEKLNKIYSSSDVLFLTNYKDVEGWYPVKLFDYLSAGIPMLLCPSDKDVMESFINELQCGHIANTQDECEEIIVSMLKEKSEKGKVSCNVNYEKAKKYSRSHQTKLLAELLKLNINE